MPGTKVFGDQFFELDSENYSLGDTVMLYSLLRYLKPRRYVEIGSGQTTLIALAAIAAAKEIEPDYICNVTCIEPYEQPWLEKTHVTVRRQRVEMTDRQIFNDLTAGDILFIDSFACNPTAR